MHAAYIASALKGRRSGAGWICLCPAHDDHHPSLAVIDRDGKALVNCRSGCSQNAVINALKRLRLWDGRAHDRDRGSRPSAPRSGSVKDPMKPWRNGSPFIRGSPVDRYLRSRAIALTDEEARSLRFSSSIWHWPTRSRWPAMLARVVAYERRRSHHPPNLSPTRRLRQSAARRQGPPVRCGRQMRRRRGVVRRRRPE